MDYNRIVAVTGLPGLYEVVSSKTDGAIVRSLEDKSTRFVSSRVHNLSHLESIEVYTARDNVQLSDIFTAMQSSNEQLPDVKDNKALKSYFEKVYPDLDFERVYSSDMKKMVKWYEVITGNDIDFTIKEEVAADEVPAITEEAIAEEPVKKAVKVKVKKKPVAKEAPEATAGDAEKPKRGRKKKTEE
jgi:hypothetical protein